MFFLSETNIGKHFLKRCMCVHAQSCLTLCNPMDCVAHQVGFSRQEYWSGLPFRPSGDLPNPGIEPASLAAPALAGRFFTTEPPEDKRVNILDFVGQEAN